jgi:RNA polymerase sigma factor (sigma-70 family)
MFKQVSAFKEVQDRRFPNLSANIELRPLLVENLRDLPDDRLLELVLGPDANPGSWEELVRRIQGYSKGVVYRVLCRAGQETYTDDLIQNLLDKLIANNCRRLRKVKFQHENSLKAFVITVARRLAIDHIRSRGGTAPEELPDLRDPRPGPDFAILMKEIFAYVQENTAPDEYDIFRLRYLCNFSVPEICKLPDIDRQLKEVEYVIWKIVQMLRKRFAGDPSRPPSKKS